MKRNTLRTVVSMALTMAMVLMLIPLAAAPVVAQVKVIGPTDRTVLPIPEPKVPDSTVFDARDATAPPRFQVSAPTAWYEPKPGVSAVGVFTSKTASRRTHITGWA